MERNLKSLLKVVKNTIETIIEETKSSLFKISGIKIVIETSCKCFFLGNSIISTIEEALNDSEADSGFSFKKLEDRVQLFTDILRRNEEYFHWAEILKHQIEDIKACTIKKQPPSSRENSNLSIDSNSSYDDFHDFVTFYDNYTKIPCTVPGCPSSFAHKRTYEYHMKTQHKNEDIDYQVEDISGTCRMFINNTMKECGRKIPLRTMYKHLIRYHNTHRPTKKHKLYGFFKKPIPKAVFLLKGQDRKFLKSLQNRLKRDLEMSVSDKDNISNSMSINDNSNSMTGNDHSDSADAEKRETVPISKDSTNHTKPRKENHHIETDNLNAEFYGREDFRTSNMCQKNLDFSDTESNEFSSSSPTIPAKKKKIKLKEKYKKTNIGSTSTNPLVANETTTDTLEKFERPKSKLRKRTKGGNVPIIPSTKDDKDILRKNISLKSKDQAGTFDSQCTSTPVKDFDLSNVSTMMNKPRSKLKRRKRRCSSSSLPADDQYMNESTPQKNCIGNDKEQIGNISNNTCTLGYREDNPNLDDMAINKAGKLSKFAKVFLEKRALTSMTVENPLIDVHSKSIERSFSSDSTNNPNESFFSNIGSYISSDNDEEIPSNDSDTELGDSDVFTKKRIKNKRLRYLGRNRTELNFADREENRDFIRDMQHYMEEGLVGVGNKKPTTISKTMRYLFHQNDSFLNFEIQRNKSFVLENLRNFNSKDFYNLNYPRDWIITTCGEDGGKGVERLKAHANLRRYIRYEVDKFDSTAEFSSKKQLIIGNLDSIEKEVSKGRLWNRYYKMANNTHQEKNRAKLILNPSMKYNIQYCVRVWNESLEKNNLDKDYQFIYEEAIKKNDISISNLTKYAQYARMVLCLSDKSRQSAYRFKIKNYVDKLPQYYPTGYIGFEDLDSEWNPNEAPSEETTPDLWIMYVPGISNLKHCPKMSHSV